MIYWQEPPRPGDREMAAQDAVRLYEEMWPVERIASLFGHSHEAMRRLLGRRRR